MSTDIVVPAAPPPTIDFADLRRSLGPDGALESMAAVRQFILVKLVWDAEKKKWNKLPCNWHTGEVANAHDTSIHADWQTALATAELFGPGYGVGFVFIEGGGWWFVDIDNCIVDGVWSPLALQIVDMLQSCAMEISVSGKGFHIFGRATPMPAHGCKNVPRGLECYSSGRFVLLGHNAMGNAALDATAAFAKVVENYFPPKAGGKSKIDWAATQAVNAANPPDMSDDELIAKACKVRSSAATFGTKASFKDLWELNVDKLAKAFPVPEGDNRKYDGSSADQALCNHLAWWCRKDPVWMWRILMTPGYCKLYRDEKWNPENHKDYIERTIKKALVTVATARGTSKPPTSPAPGEPPDAPPEGTPNVINIEAGNVDGFVAEAAAALVETKQVYQRLGALVHLQRDISGNTVVSAIGNHTARVWLNELRTFTKWNTQKGKRVVTDPPMPLIDDLLGCERYADVPELIGISQQPFLRKDGTMMLDPGFDQATGIYGAFQPNAFNVPERPTKDQAVAALGELAGLLGEFNFVSPIDRAMMVVGILTAAMRSSITIAPFFLNRAHQIASGKSYASQLMQAFAMGWDPDSVRIPESIPQTKEEWTKSLPAIFIGSPPAVWFDNFVDDIPDHPDLCAIFTTGAMSARLFGRNDKKVTVQARSFVSGTGNNVGICEGMSRRVAVINMDKVPGHGAYKANPLRTVLLNRPKFVSLAMTIVRAWIVAGSPQTPCIHVDSFDHWTQLCRQPLMWLDQQDVGSAFQTTQVADPDAELWERFCAAWDKFIGTKAITLANALKDAQAVCPYVPDPFAGSVPVPPPPPHAAGAKDLIEIRTEIGKVRGFDDPRQFAHWIERQSGKWTPDAIRLKKTGRKYCKVDLWQLERHSSYVPPPPVAPIAT